MSIFTYTEFSFAEIVPEWLFNNYQTFLVPLMIYPIMVHMWPIGLKVDSSNKIIRRALFVWNTKLALYSIVSVYKLTPHLFRRLYQYGYEETICVRNYNDSYKMMPYGWWIFAFVVSKIFELGDTFFLLIRGKKVTFLHWYHHMITLLFVYVQSVLLIETAEWLIWMNLVVHSFMYSYYAISVYKPVNGSTILTGLQVLQMLHGMFLTGYHISYCDNCEIKDYPGFVLYTIYTFLFTKYFVQRYIPYFKVSKIKSA